MVDENGNEIIFRVGSWYLELKATERNYAAMTKLQAKRAVDNPDCYALVILPLNNYEINGENILLHVKFVNNMGKILRQKYDEVATLKIQQELVVISTDDVEVAIEKEDIRYHVRQSVWISGDRMDDFIKGINRQTML